jgi:hypothetical protein
MQGFRTHFMYIVCDPEKKVKVASTASTHPWYHMRTEKLDTVYEVV